MSQSPDRLYDLLPAVYRLRDAEQGYPLKALMTVIAEQVNIVEDDISQLYDNWFIETSQDWVVPYLGDLIGYKPVYAPGQIQGGSAQGLGYALLEDVVMRDGRMANAQLTNYIIPTTVDSPPIKVVLLQQPYSGGPWGAKGLGELPMNGIGSAVVAALRQATGAWFDGIPVTPERVLAALERREREAGS